MRKQKTLSFCSAGWWNDALRLSVMPAGRLKSSCDWRMFRIMWVNNEFKTESVWAPEFLCENKLFVPRLPVAVISIAAVLLCFYHHLKKRREQRDATVRMQVQAICRPEDQEVDTEFDRCTPGYSAMEHPPPYSLVMTDKLPPMLHHISPKLTFQPIYTCVWEQKN